MPFRLETLFPKDLERHIALSPTLVLPFGTIEWHSHHLPVGLDGLVAQHMGERMAEAMNAVLAPTGYWAVGGVPFPFTLNLPLETIEALLATILQQHGAMGFKTLVVFTGHFGLDQTLATKRSALHVMQQSDVTILPFTTYDLVTDFYSGDHAGIGESSLMMALRPDLVRLSDWPTNEPLPGVIGDDPRLTASPELGQRIFRESASRAARLVSGFRTDTLSRQEWIATLEIVVQVLEKTQALRKAMSRADVPPVTTFAYLQGWAAVCKGQLSDAQAFFLTKLAELNAVSPSATS